MKKFIISTLVLVGVLLLATIFPSSIGVPDKTMEPPDGNTHTVGTTTTPPTLDGIVDVGSSWPSSSWVGSAYIATDPTAIADVYMLVEVDNENLIENLWVGVNVLSPYYLVPGDGQWVRIDWDQDGMLDFEDHAGSGTTDGVDTSSGAEWMIPWGKVRVNPSDTGTEPIDPAIIANSFDIFVHIEANKDGWEESETATFPGRPDAGEFKSTTFNVQFGPPNNGDDDFGIRSMGFWKHQFRTALGEPGHQHVATDDLNDYLDEIDSGTDLDELKGLDLMDALMLFEPDDHSIMYDKAVQQLLATWLNLVSDGDQMVDTDCDGTADMMLSDAIDYVEDILTDTDATKGELEEAKNICDCINNSGSE